MPESAPYNWLARLVRGTKRFYGCSCKVEKDWRQSKILPNQPQFEEMFAILEIGK